MAWQTNSDLKAAIQSTNTLLRKIDSLSLAERFSFVSDRIPVYVKTLYDGYDGLSNRLVDGSYDKLVNGQIEFLHLPVTCTCETFESPLVLLCDSTEPDRESVGKMIRRADNGYVTYPLVLFPDDFFRLNPGERLSYVDICDSVQEHTKETPLPLKEGDFTESSVYLQIYLQCINYGIRLYSARNCIKALSRHIEETYLGAEESGDVFSRLVQLERKSAAVKQLRTLTELYNSITSLLKSWDGIKNSARADYDKRIHSFVFRNNNAYDSPVTVRFDLQYKSYTDSIVRFANIARNNAYIDSECLRKASTLADDTLEKLNSNTTTLAFIGTFSSGKTTFINALLGMKRTLPTSARHNTAILTQINNSDKPWDYYKFDYSEKLEWDIISPTSFDSAAFVNHFNCKARVVSVYKENNSHIVTLKMLEPPHDSCRKHITGAREPRVSPGDILRPGQSLVKESKDLNTWQICPYNELLHIEDVLKSKNAYNIKQNGLSAESQDILSLISKLKTLWDESANRKSERRERKETLARALGISASGIEPVFFSCTVRKPKDLEVPLDERAWTALCGNPDDANSVALTEHPSCYMAAKKLNLYFQSDFLKYATLVDTPGFGSVTEKHDHITERYIRNEANHLIVMVAIYMHSDDMKFNDLINKIAELYDQYNKNKNPDNVRFVLNCFTNDMPFAECEKRARAIKNSIVNMGFKEENIYACNLRNAIAKNITNESIAGCKTYDDFKTDCLEYILLEGHRQKLSAIQSAWTNFFRNNRAELMKRKRDIEDSIHETDKKIRSKKQALSEVNRVVPPNLALLTKEVEDSFNQLYKHLCSAFIGTRKGFFVKKRKKQVEEAYRMYFRNNENYSMCENEENEFCDKIRNRAYKLENFGERDDITEDFPQKSPGNLIVVTHQGIQNLLSEADANTHFWNKTRKTNYYMSKLKRIIDEDCNISKDNISSFFQPYIERLTEYRDHIAKRLSEEINLLENSGDMTTELQSLSRAISELNQLEYTFMKLNFDIEEK